MKRLLDEFNVRGFVLKEQSYKENDKIVWILCEDIGKISVLAKNAKKNKNQNFLLTQSFSLVQLNLKKGKNFYYIQDGTLIKNIDFINKYEKIFYFTYMFELLDIGFSERDEVNKNFFDFSIKFMFFLELEETNNNMLVRFFELRLLKELGCNFEFEYCYYCNKKIRDNLTYFDFSLQSVVCIFCSKLKEFKIENRTINIIRFLSKVDIINISKLKISEEDLHLITKMNKAFLEQNLVRMPKSLEFLDKF